MKRRCLVLFLVGILGAAQSGPVSAEESSGFEETVFFLDEKLEAGSEDVDLTLGRIDYSEELDLYEEIDPSGDEMEIDFGGSIFVSPEDNPLTISDSSLEDIDSNIIEDIAAAEVYSGYADGLALDSDGKWKVYKNNQVDINYNGIIGYAGGDFFIANGVLCSEANGLQLYDGIWYFLSNGQVQLYYTGLVQYDHEWFYITNGILDNSKNGLVDYDGSKFLVSEGRIRYDVNGLWQDFDGKWYYLANGQVQTQYTGVVQYDGAFFYVKEGLLAAEITGAISYDGSYFKVVKGQLYDHLEKIDVLDYRYICNVKTLKVHYPECRSVSKMKEENRWYTDLNLAVLIEEGYEPCKICKP